MIIFIFFLCLIPFTVSAANLFSDGFESGDLSHVDLTSGVAWGASNAGAGDDVSISSANARTGQYSLAFTFAGNADLADDAWAEQRFNLSSTYDEIYIQFYIFYPQNYIIRDTGGSNNTKLFYLWGDDYTLDMNKVGIEYEIGMRPGFKAKVAGSPLVPNCSGATGYPTTWEFSTTSIASLKGRWAQIEIYTRRDTGLGDGAYKLWIDGTIEADFQNISWVGAPCGVSQFFRNGYLMGWSNSGFTEDTIVYIDDVVFSTSYIGTQGFNRGGFTSSLGCSMR